MAGVFLLKLIVSAIVSSLRVLQEAVTSCTTAVVRLQSLGRRGEGPLL